MRTPHTLTVGTTEPSFAHWSSTAGARPAVARAPLARVTRSVAGTPLVSAAPSVARAASARATQVVRAFIQDVNVTRQAKKKASGLRTAVRILSCPEMLPPYRRSALPSTGLVASAVCVPVC